MKIVSAIFGILTLMIITAFQTALASSSLEISTTSDFTALSTNFSGGQTIFVRLASNLPSSAESRLNLRDNNYQVINSFPMNKDGEYFRATITTPYDSGYYSLEGVLKHNGSNTTSVKTIKLGNPTSANVRVNVNSSAQRSRILGENKEEDGVSEGSEGSEADQQEVNGQAAQKSEKNFGQYLISFMREIADFLWPF